MLLLWFIQGGRCFCYGLSRAGGASVMVYPRRAVLLLWFIQGGRCFCYGLSKAGGASVVVYPRRAVPLLWFILIVIVCPLLVGL